jgi:hypothetical protein
MQYHFEKYNRPPRGKTSDPTTISLTQSGAIGLSAAFYQQQEIHRFAYVHFFYDPLAKALALVFATEKAKNGYKISPNPSSGATISAVALFRKFNLSPIRHKGRYTWKKQTIKGIGTAFIIEL